MWYSASPLDFDGESYAATLVAGDGALPSPLMLERVHREFESSVTTTFLLIPLNPWRSPDCRAITGMYSARSKRMRHHPMESGTVATGHSSGPVVDGDIVLVVARNGECYSNSSRINARVPASSRHES